MQIIAFSLTENQQKKILHLGRYHFAHESSVAGKQERKKKLLYLLSENFTHDGIEKNRNREY